MAVGSPRWSPDGTRIVFDGFPAGSGEIYIVQSQGGSPLRVTNDAFADASPSWSGDGRWIYFVSTRGADREVWKVRSDLPNAEPAPVTRTGATFAPVAAADGYVYYLKRGAVWRVPAGGGDERSQTDSVDNVQWYALAPGGLVLLFGVGPQGSRV
jgi:Tol biopolymer transport system component